jgi:hypothetical protein
MATKVDESIVVDVPVSTAYDQWTQFEDFPHFMGGISEVKQLNDTTLHWVAEIGGVKREWDATILEQVPNEKIAWAATEGATNAGAVYFASAGPEKTTVSLHLEYEPEGAVEKAGDAAGIVERRAKADLAKFKSVIEDAGYASGAWRGNVPGAAGTPGVEAAESSKGDSGKAGISAKAVVAGAAGAAAGVAAAKALSGSGEAERRPEEEEVVVVETEVPPATDAIAPADTALPADSLTADDADPATRTTTPTTDRGV